ncbi:tRNA-dihydrouridine(47) synthase [NAD(P)(+)]-like [Centruroides vittatus]|uniref:tRNA-dihydrouridine(47) synthase [NAD(P)(+)]-like n=1 Tax=Centruroides vittatus TaxID=120091 RepID=UPI0035103A94
MAETGAAPIKNEFLLPIPCRQLNLDYVTSSDKKKLLSEVELNGEKEKGPPRKKLKGQNKNRPRETKKPKADKLCLKFISEAGCPFGDGCCFSHDIRKFMESKPPDVPGSCYLFDTYGKCPYSFICRFGSNHISDQGKNVIDEEKWKKFEGMVFTTNVLTRDLQISLRKREYNFSKADSYLKLITSGEFRRLMGSEPINCDKTQVQEQNDVKDTNKCDITNLSAITNECAENNEKTVLKDCIEVQHETSDLENLQPTKQLSGCVTDEDVVKTRINERRKIDFKGKLYLAPLTTVGNLPFRRICKEFGADITCSEMALAVNVLQGQQSEWALLKRHSSETIFGVQLCGSFADIMTRCAQLVYDKTDADFIDINMGCPIDLVYQKGAGCGMMGRVKKLEEIIFGMSSVVPIPLTVKMRTGIHENKNIAHNVIGRMHSWRDRIDLISLHGRSREQRYTKLADWNYIDRCAKLADPIPLFGSGDILSFEDVDERLNNTSISGVMIARGALIKPWIFDEIKERRHWDISSSERFDVIKRYVNYGLEHWGSDTEGVEKTRRFLLEWLSFAHRYIPIGLLERLPQKINERPSPYRGRNDLETLLASPSCADWIKISEMLLGPIPENFTFLPKHKANAYS